MKQMILMMSVLTMFSCGKDGGDDTPENSLDQNDLGANSENTITIDASSKTDWVYVDIDANFAISAEESADWDIAFRRYLIMLNPNANPPTSAAVVESYLDDIDSIPGAESFLLDEVTENQEEGLVFNGESPWYNYDMNTHVLTPKEPLSYLVQTSEDSVYGIAIMDYYDEFGTSGYVSFTYKKL